MKSPEPDPQLHFSLSDIFRGLPSSPEINDPEKISLPSPLLRCQGGLDRDTVNRGAFANQVRGGGEPCPFGAFPPPPTELRCQGGLERDTANRGVFGNKVRGDEAAIAPSLPTLMK